MKNCTFAFPGVFNGGEIEDVPTEFKDVFVCDKFVVDGDFGFGDFKPFETDIGWI